MRTMAIRWVVLAIGGPAMLMTACDRSTSTSEKTTYDNGKVTKQKETVREDAAGNVTVEKEKTQRSAEER